MSLFHSQDYVSFPHSSSIFLIRMAFKCETSVHDTSSYLIFVCWFASAISYIFFRNTLAIWELKQKWKNNNYIALIRNHKRVSGVCLIWSYFLAVSVIKSAKFILVGEKETVIKRQQANKEHTKRKKKFTKEIIEKINEKHQQKRTTRKSFCYAFCSLSSFIIPANVRQRGWKVYIFLIHVMWLWICLPKNQYFIDFISSLGIIFSLFSTATAASSFFCCCMATLLFCRTFVIMDWHSFSFVSITGHISISMFISCGTKQNRSISLPNKYTNTIKTKAEC